MVGQREFMDVHDAWIEGKSISEIARQTGRDRKTIQTLWLYIYQPTRQWCSRRESNPEPWD